MARYLVTHGAHVAHLAEVLLADGEVLVGEVLVHHLLPAHLALTTQGFQDTEYICPQLMTLLYGHIAQFWSTKILHCRIGYEVKLVNEECGKYFK